MNTTSRTRIAALALLAGTALVPAARAAIDINDSATYYAAENWYAIRNGGTPTITPTANSVSVGTLKYDGLFFCYFEPVVLSAGQYLKISGTLNLSEIYAGSTTTNTVLGLFDSGDYPQTKLDSALAEKSLGHGYNSAKLSEMSASQITGTMSGFAVSTVSAFDRNNPSTNSACLATNSGGKRIEAYSTALSEPTAGNDYAFEICITKEDAGTYALAFSLGGSDEKTYTSLENTALEKLDVFAVKAKVATGATATLSNLAISTTGTVIPEPSAFGLMFGVLSLLVAAFPRRRSRKG